MNINNIHFCFVILNTNTFLSNNILKSIFLIKLKIKNIK